jgi:hypothetical protein
MTWANHPTTKHPIRLHYNCRIKGDTHYFEVGVIPREDGFEVFIPEQYAGAPFLHTFSNLDKLNMFLELRGLEPIPERMLQYLMGKQKR